MALVQFCQHFSPNLQATTSMPFGPQQQSQSTNNSPAPARGHSLPRSLGSSNTVPNKQKSDFKKQGRRNRLGDKLETMDFDPLVQKRVLFKEVKKIKTLSVPTNQKYPEWLKHPTKVSYPKYFNVDD